MVNMRVVRHDRHEQTLADCQTAVIPSRGEVIQLDTTDASGEMTVVGRSSALDQTRRIRLTGGPSI